MACGYGEMCLLRLCNALKNNIKDNDTTVTQENVTTADKNNTKKSSKVVFDYTDADGVTTKLEGNATVSDNGEATIEVIDNNGNKQSLQERLIQIMESYQ